MVITECGGETVGKGEESRKREGEVAEMESEENIEMEI